MKFILVSSFTVRISWFDVYPDLIYILLIYVIVMLQYIAEKYETRRKIEKCYIILGL